MTARLANGGKKVNPRLVRSVTGQTLEGAVLPPADDEAANRDIGVSQSALKTVLSGMNKVVNGPRGSARAAKIQVEGWEMAGKTGRRADCPRFITGNATSRSVAPAQL